MKQIVRHYKNGSVKLARYLINTKKIMIVFSSTFIILQFFIKIKLVIFLY